MKRRAIGPTAALPAALLLILAACEVKKSANPLSPSVAGPIAGVEITAPRLLEPGQGFRYKESQQPVRLLIENSTSNGVRPITYVFEVASDSNFETKMFARAGVPPGDGGRTSVVIDRLGLGRSYYWRVRADDGANRSVFSSSHFEILPEPQISVPALLSPVNNEQVSSRRPTLTIGNSSRNVAVGDVYYEFQIATSPAFTQIVATSDYIGEGSGQTSWVPGRDLADNLQHYWRARATDREAMSAWGGTQSFRTPVAPPAPGPTPPPTSAGGGTACGPPYPSTPESIVACQRSKYGHMGEGELVEFLRAVARDLNKHGVSGGPFGVLVKTGGTNCHGYSCDIICSGQGGAQRQWDVLGDAEGAQDPKWDGPLPSIVVRPCEIQ